MENVQRTYSTSLANFGGIEQQPINGIWWIVRSAYLTFNTSIKAIALVPLDNDHDQPFYCLLIHKSTATEKHKSAAQSENSNSTEFYTNEKRNCHQPNKQRNNTRREQTNPNTTGNDATGKTTNCHWNSNHSPVFVVYVHIK